MTSDSDIDKLCESLSLSEKAALPPAAAKPTAPIPRKRWPWFMFIVGAGLLMVGIWFGTCSIHLEPGTRLFPFYE
jgi:hypothetical protein